VRKGLTFICELAQHVYHQWQENCLGLVNTFLVRVNVTPCTRYRSEEISPKKRVSDDPRLWKHNNISYIEETGDGILFSAPNILHKVKYFENVEYTPITPVTATLYKY
jgi:hypothetical protein